MEIAIVKTAAIVLIWQLTSFTAKYKMMLEEIALGNARIA